MTVSHLLVLLAAYGGDIPGNGHASDTVSVPGAVTLVPGPSAAVVTVSHGTTYLHRPAG